MKKVDPGPCFYLTHLRSSLVYCEPFCVYKPDTGIKQLVLLAVVEEYHVMKKAPISWCILPWIPTEIPVKIHRDSEGIPSSQMCINYLIPGYGK